MAQKATGFVFVPGAVVGAVSGYDVLRDLVREDVQMIRDTLGVLRLLEMPRGARSKLEARREALQAQDVFEREQGTGFGATDHERLRVQAS